LDNEIWADEALLAAFSINVGQRIQLGEAQFVVSLLVTQEPDRPMAFANFAPRVLLSQAGLARTQLLQLGSRVTYKLLVVTQNNDVQAVKRFEAWAKDALEKGQRLDTVKNGRPEIRSTLERAEQFLSLAALLGTLVASVGVALVSHHFAKQKIPEIALLKSLGFTPSQLLRLWGAGLLIVAVVGGGLGALLGYTSHHGLVYLLASFVGTELPPAGMESIYIALLMGLVLTLGFAGVPLLGVLKVTPVFVLRQDAQPAKRFVLSAVVGVSAMFALCVLAAGKWLIAILVLGGALLATLLFAVLAWFSIRLGLRIFNALSQTGQSFGLSFRFAWLSLSRRVLATVLQGVALTVGLTALLLLAVLRGDLLDGWQKAIPANAPNRFALNIQPGQQPDFESLLKSGGVAAPELYPMVRGRLVAVNQAEINLDTYGDERAKRLLDREFNLSYGDQMPQHNRLISGAWFKGGAPEVSIEESIAKTLGLSLGDQLTFDVAAQRITAPITSIRGVEWDSMQVNFYVIFPTEALKDFPQSWITAFFLPTSTSQLGAELLKRFPNITLVDTGLVMEQVRSTLGRVSRAVEFIFAFTVVSGALVLVATLLTNNAARMREAGIMRALGASQTQIRRAIWMELAFVGLLAGLMAGIAAQALGYVVAQQVFKFTYVLSPLLLVAAMGMGVVIALLGGMWCVNRIVSTPPLQVLRSI
jgi:putative ABC transport system permease protein